MHRDSTIITLTLLLLNILEEKKLCYDLVLICVSLPFYAHVHTCSPSYTDVEQKTNVDSETVRLRLLIKGLIVPVRLCTLSRAYY